MTWKVKPIRFKVNSNHHTQLLSGNLRGNMKKELLLRNFQRSYLHILIFKQGNLKEVKKIIGTKPQGTDLLPRMALHTLRN